eukprot:s1912_g3.t1
MNVVRKDGMFTFERCCPGTARSAVTAVEAPSAAPQLLCSGERLQGVQRFIRFTDQVPKRSKQLLDVWGMQRLPVLMALQFGSFLV